MYRSPRERDERSHVSAGSRPPYPASTLLCFANTSNDPACLHIRARARVLARTPIPFSRLGSGPSLSPEKKGSKGVSRNLQTQSALISFASFFFIQFFFFFFFNSTARQCFNSVEIACTVAAGEVGEQKKYSLGYFIPPGITSGEVKFFNTS